MLSMLEYVREAALEHPVIESRRSEPVVAPYWSSYAVSPATAAAAGGGGGIVGGGAGRVGSTTNPLSASPLGDDFLSLTSHANRAAVTGLHQVHCGNILSPLVQLPHIEVRSRQLAMEVMSHRSNIHLFGEGAGVGGGGVGGGIAGGGMNIMTNRGISSGLLRASGSSIFAGGGRPTTAAPHPQQQQQQSSAAADGNDPRRSLSPAASPHVHVAERRRRRRNDDEEGEGEEGRRNARPSYSAPPQGLQYEDEDDEVFDDGGEGSNDYDDDDEMFDDDDDDNEEGIPLKQFDGGNEYDTRRYHQGERRTALDRHSIILDADERSVEEDESN